MSIATVNRLAQFNWLAPITTADQARQHLQTLVDNGLSYHPEDDALDVVGKFCGQRLFSPEEADALNDRMLEVVLFLDPIEFLLSATPKVPA